MTDLAIPPFGMDRYYYYRESLQIADLIEWRAETPLGWAIRQQTGMNVNHTSGVLLFRLVGDAEIRRYVDEALSSGFHPRYLTSELSGYKGEVYLNRLKSKYNEYRIPIAKEACKLEGKAYAYKDLIMNIVKPRKFDPDAKEVRCSDAWHIALYKSGFIQDKDFNNGNFLVPGQFAITGLYESPVRIF